MKRLILVAALAALLPACNFARIGFNSMQGALQDSRIYVSTDGDFKQNANMEWAYVNGTGSYDVGIVLEGNKVIHYQGTGSIKRAWRLAWEPGDSRPRVVEVPFDAAYAVLGDPPVGAE